MTYRPHYHLVMFGLDPMHSEAFMATRWPYGHIHVLPFSMKTAAYIARYTSKKYRVHKPLSFEATPEFQRMSRRPAIGAPALAAIESWMVSDAGSRFIVENGDAPASIRSEGSIFPLGRTLHLRLRRAAGLPDSLPDLQESRRAARALCLDDPAFVAALEGRRTAGYERVTRSVTARLGVH